MLQKIQQSIQEAQSRGYKLGEYFNAVIIPSHLLEEFEVEAPQDDLGVTDEVLGQIFRARLVGKNKVNSAFRKIMNYRTVEAESEKRNLAR